MTTPIDTSTLSPPAQKLLSAPPKLQEMAARGIAPGVRPDELVLLLVLFSQAEAPSLRTAADQTLGNLPPPVLNGVLATDMHPAAIHAIAARYADRMEVLERIMAMPRLEPETVMVLAEKGGEAATELIATNEQRLLENPRIIELLYLNKKTRMSTADRLVELAVRNGIELNIAAWREASAAIANELIPEASSEPTPDDVHFAETHALAEQLTEEHHDGEASDTHDEDDEGNQTLKQKFEPLWSRIANMTPTQKIRLAQIGTREERMLLVRDSNKMVSVAAVRSPQMTEPDAVLISRNKSMADDVLRVVGTTPEFLKSYQVKKNLAENPKTPVMIATRMITHLREFDLRALARSKNIPGPVKDAAKNHLARRKR